MNSRLRDLAIFGTLFTRQREGEVISKEIIDKILKSDSGNPYFWDFVIDRKILLKGGFGKQLLIVVPDLNLVVAQFNHP